MGVKRSSAAGLQSPRTQRIDGSPTPQEVGARHLRVKGGQRPAWKQQAARGPVPPCAKVKTFLKGKGVVRPMDNLKDCSAVLLRDKKQAELAKPQGKHRSQTPEGNRQQLPFRYFSEDSRTDPLPGPCGIRMIPKGETRDEREDRYKEARMRSNSAYQLRAPYASQYNDEVVDGGRRPSRRHVNPSSSPGVESRGSLMGGEESPARRRGKNFACRPIEVGIFDKPEISPRTCRYISPHHRPTALDRQQRDERHFLPTNYREKGFLSSTREGSTGVYAKGGAGNRPAGSLITAWNIAQDAPSSMTTGVKKTLQQNEPSPCPWGIGRRLSTTKYHRKQSLDALRIEENKRRSRRPARTQVPERSASVSSWTIGQQGGGYAPESPRSGKRMVRSSSSNSIIASWR